MSDRVNSVSALTVKPSALPQSADGKNLAVGDRLSGQVLEARDGKVLLNIGGEKIVADSSLTFSRGDVLQLEFTGVSDGLLTLRLLTLNRGLAFSPLTLEDVTVELANLKLPTNETTARLAKSMVEFGLPLTREMVLELLKAVQGRSDDFTMQAASFLKNAQIPLTLENVQALARFFEGKPELGKLLGQLQSYAQSVSGSDGKLAQLLSMLPGILGEYLLEPRKERKRNLERIERLARTAGMKKGTGDLLTDLLLALRTEVKDADETLHQTLSRLEGLLRGEQLLNSDRRPEGVLYFQIPATFQGDKVTAEVRIRYEREKEGKRRVDPEKARVEFSMITPRLGTIQCQLDIVKRSIAGKLFVDDRREAFVESHIDWLAESLKKLKYQVVLLHVAGEPYDFWPMNKSEFRSLEKVNVKV